MCIRDSDKTLRVRMSKFALPVLEVIMARHVLTLLAFLDLWTIIVCTTQFAPLPTESGDWRDRELHFPRVQLDHSIRNLALNKYLLLHQPTQECHR